MNTIGIDLGTSAMKLLAVDEQGRTLKTVSREYPLRMPHPGWSEQDPEEWKNALMDGLAEMFETIDPKSIGAIGTAGQMHGLVILDENDEVIRPAILWNDGRTERENVFLNEKLGKGILLEETANISFAGFTLPKILWLKNNEPENFEKIRKVMLPKDYITWLLCGNHVTDYSDAAGTLLLDVRNKKWSDKMMETAGLKEEQLPKLHESKDAVGALKEEWQVKFGLPSETVVCAGAGDNAAAAIGMGVMGEGGCSISLGTSGTLFLTSETCPQAGNPAIHCFNHADGCWHLMGCILSAASCNMWWMDEILKTRDYAAEQQDIPRALLGHNPVYFLPYLMGERSPHNDTKVRSCMIGMSLNTTRASMTLAVLEGVAFAFRDCLEAARKQGINPESAAVCGGGAQSDLWLEILASVLNLPLQVPVQVQGPGLGAAFLAKAAADPDLDMTRWVKEHVRFERTVEPNPELVGLYDKNYQHYTKIYPAIRELF